MLKCRQSSPASEFNPPNSEKGKSGEEKGKRKKKRVRGGKRRKGTQKTEFSVHIISVSGTI